MFATLLLRSPHANITKVPAEKKWRFSSSLARPFLGAPWRRLVLRRSADFLAGVLPREAACVNAWKEGLPRNDAHFGIGTVAIFRFAVLRACGLRTLGWCPSCHRRKAIDPGFCPC